MPTDFLEIRCRIQKSNTVAEEVISLYCALLFQIKNKLVTFNKKASNMGLFLLYIKKVSCGDAHDKGTKLLEV